MISAWAIFIKLYIVSNVCSTLLSLISLNSLDDVDNVSEPTIQLFTPTQKSVL